MMMRAAGLTDVTAWAGRAGQGRAGVAKGHRQFSYATASLPLALAAPALAHRPPRSPLCRISSTLLCSSFLSCPPPSSSSVERHKGIVSRQQQAATQSRRSWFRHLISLSLPPSRARLPTMMPCLPCLTLPARCCRRVSPYSRSPQRARDMMTRSACPDLRPETLRPA